MNVNGTKYCDPHFIVCLRNITCNTGIQICKIYFFILDVGGSKIGLHLVKRVLIQTFLNLFYRHKKNGIQECKCDINFWLCIIDLNVMDAI